jgi:hypothetical protein
MDVAFRFHRQTLIMCSPNSQPFGTPYHCSILALMSIAALARISMHALLPGLRTVIKNQMVLMGLHVKECRERSCTEDDMT